MTQPIHLCFGHNYDDGEGQGKVPPPAPPSDQLEPVPPGTNPLFSIELVGNDHISVRAIWPQGSDVSNFAQLLAMLVGGNLIGPISAAVAVTGNRNREPEKAAAIHALMMQIVGSRGKKKQRGSDCPVVLPSEAIKYNMKPHRV